MTVHGPPYTPHQFIPFICWHFIAAKLAIVFSKSNHFYNIFTISINHFLFVPLSFLYITSFYNIDRISQTDSSFFPNSKLFFFC